MRPEYLRDRTVLKVGERVRLLSYTCSHDRLTLLAQNDDGAEAKIELVMCAKVKFMPLWRAERLAVTPAPGEQGLLMVSDRDFEVVCEEVQRWEVQDEPAIRLTSKDFL